jgi:predicted Fe-Mo cluster-binding NifX family protein
MIIAVASEYGASFDRFVYFNIKGERVMEREEVNVAPGGVSALAGQLHGLEVDVFIVGKISDSLADELREAGILLIRGVEGRCDSVASAYLQGTLAF